MHPTHLLGALCLSLVACAHAEPSSSAPNDAAPATTSVELKPAAKSGGGPPAEEDRELRGTVIEAVDAAGYTYLRVALDDDREVWAAATKQPIAVGTYVELMTSIKMVGFHSKGLDRTFDVIYFVEVTSKNEAPETTKEDQTPSGFL